jgi:hypothetical protein
MADAIQVNKTLVAVFIAVPVLTVLVLIVLITTGIRRRQVRRRNTLRSYILAARA